MTKEQIQALVNKGVITHVGITEDLEKMSDKEICGRYITKHEVAAEIIEEGNGGMADVVIKMNVEGTPKVGEIVTTKVSIESTKYEGTPIRVRATIDPANATKPKYKEGDKWLDLPIEGVDGVYYFGGSNGFPLTNGAVSEFSNECLVAGDVTTTLEVIDVTSGSVIGSDSITINVAKATKKAAAKKVTAPVVDPVE